MYAPSTRVNSAVMDAPSDPFDKKEDIAKFLDARDELEGVTYIFSKPTSRRET